MPRVTVAAAVAAGDDAAAAAAEEAGDAVRLTSGGEAQKTACCGSKVANLAAILSRVCQPLGRASVCEVKRYIIQRVPLRPARLAELALRDTAHRIRPSSITGKAVP